MQVARRANGAERAALPADRIGRHCGSTYDSAAGDGDAVAQCAETETLFNRVRVKRFANIESVARRKLLQLDAAIGLDLLRVPPGNRLAALTGNRQGQHSIRINDQFRVCFAWTLQGAQGVDTVDYH